MGTDDDDGSTSAREQHRSHGAKTVECSCQICCDDLVPDAFRMTDKQPALGDSRIADKRRCDRRLMMPVVDHSLDRVRLADVGMVQQTCAAAFQDLPERRFSCRLVAAIVDADVPTDGGEGSTDGPADAAGCAGDEHRGACVQSTGPDRGTRVLWW